MTGIHVRTLKAQPIVEGMTVRGAIIEISQDCPDFDSLPAQAATFQSEAEQIENALRNSLPGGLYDRLLGVMLRYKASHFIVSWAHLDKESEDV